ncbi:MAG: TetR/AcrR family transcriptional regulator [Henriciella sp.]
MNDQSDTRDQILTAARARITHYGYAKTTMAEIASDCAMSVGNIYRFFGSKLDIAEALARKANLVLHQKSAALVRGEGTAPEKLHAIHQTALKETFRKLDHEPKLVEVADILSRQRPDYTDEELAQERVFIAQILEQGVNEGHFAPIENPAWLAGVLQSATMKFRFPQMFSPLPLAKLEAELRGILEIVVSGLAVPDSTSPDTENE